MLRATHTHPTAEDIHGQLKADFPQLSLGTVYRNLGILVEQGLAARIELGSGYDRFEANIEPHYHFICESCGSMMDLELPVDTALDRRVSEATPFTVRRHRIEFFGICDKCRARNRA